MSTPNNSAVPAYTQGFGTASIANAFIAANSPGPTNIIGPNGPFKLGQIWVNSTNDSGYILVGLNTFQGTVSAVWEQFSSTVGLLSQLTGNSGVATPIAENINVVGAGGLITTTGSAGNLSISSTAGGYPITPFVVGPVGKAGYQTVQSAIDAANTAGGGSVYIQTGIWRENLTIYTGLSLIGVDADGNSVQVTIHGNHTLAVGNSPFPIGLSRINFETASNVLDLFSTAAAISVGMVLTHCNLRATSNYVISVPNLTTNPNVYFVMQNCTVLDGGLIFTNTPISLNVSNSNLAINGSTPTLVNNGGSWVFSDVLCPAPISNLGGTFQGTNCIFDDTISGSLMTTGVMILNRCSIFSDIDPAIVVNGNFSFFLFDCILGSTSPTNAIDGTSTGSSQIVAVSFTDNDVVNPVLTVTVKSTFITGRFIVGTSDDDPRSFCSITSSQISPAEIYGLQLTGNMDGGSGGSIYNLFDNTVMSPTVSGGTLVGLNTNARFYPVTGVTCPLAVGVYSAPFVNDLRGTLTLCSAFYSAPFNGPIPGGGVLTSAYGGYFNIPGQGTNQTALYADNISIGFINITPPSSGLCVSGQVSVGASSVDSSAIIGAQSTTQGVLFPNMTTVQKNAIVAPAAGLMVFDTTLSQMSYWSGAAWVNF